MTFLSSGKRVLRFGYSKGHVQVVVGMIDDELDPQAALDRPRLCLSEANPQSGVQLEEGISKVTMDELARMRHAVIPVSSYSRATFGRGQIIRREPEVYCGVEAIHARMAARLEIDKP